MAVDIRQTAVGAVVFNRKPFVVDPQKVQKGGMNIVIGDLALGGPPRPWITFPQSHPLLDARPGKPSDGGSLVVIAPRGSLSKGLAAKLGHTDKNGLLQKPSAMEVDQ